MGYTRAPAICEKWKIDSRFYYCRTAEGAWPNDRRAYLAVDDGFGNLIEVTLA